MNALSWVELAKSRDEFRETLRLVYTVEVNWPDFPAAAAHAASDGHRIHVAPALGNPITVDTRAKWILAPLAGVMETATVLGHVSARDLRRAAKEAKAIGAARYQRELDTAREKAFPRKTLRGYEKPIRYAPAVRLGNRWYNAGYLLDALKGVKGADASEPGNEYRPLVLRRDDGAIAFVMSCKYTEADGWPTVEVTP